MSGAAGVSIVVGILLAPLLFGLIGLGLGAVAAIRDEEKALWAIGGALALTVYAVIVLLFQS